MLILSNHRDDNAPSRSGNDGRREDQGSNTHIPGGRAFYPRIDDRQTERNKKTAQQWLEEWERNWNKISGDPNIKPKGKCISNPESSTRC